LDNGGGAATKSPTAPSALRTTTGPPGMIG